ncbi:carboxypeptidase-like regulatory domain-containing protein [Salegentibacter sp. LM13S]|uniref:carboxypeptidase-like regulatory domain-containing protein n=1 Tax=Salegentibacter lacus TaxID=2873599 RepID=UPI001CCE36BA|nr:carboxypeptidase-like regulatory domain-containing protein [Salegentibacter lacus]MBZ9631654.1 carboxypeptidase-like regulatory domain-containing protein [Salegentibacter lacus]
MNKTFLHFLMLISLSGYAQSSLFGKILDENNQTLSGATVIVSKDTTGTILAYGISNGEGDFKVNLHTEVDSLFLKISYIGYRTWQQRIQNKDQRLEIALSPSSEALKEVLVESKIIDHRGDTISYSVSAFKDQKDRVIADVLKKMPGIEILPGGQIEYQGEPIQKYYIEGLDLLEGRYSLANNNISADDVSKVQILENHQPVKLLDSLEFSERASLNIKLKKNVTVSGSAELGAGSSPLLWKSKVTPMLFTKQNQAIVTYQANNTGSDVSREIRDFSIADFGREEFNSSKSDWLSIRQLAEPPFSQERWLDNNVHLGSANYLIRLKKDVDLKTNISYLNDAQQQIGNTQTRFFTPTDTIDLLERTNNDLFINSLQSKFILEKNTDDDYLKNELEINGFWDSQRGNIGTGNSQIRQRLSNPFSVIRNKLRLLKPVGKQLVTFRSNTGYTEANQNLQVQPGQFEARLNNEDNSAEMQQNIEASTFFSDNTAGFTKKIKEVTVSPEVGVSVKNQSLGSELSIFDNNEDEVLGGDFQNNLDFLSSRFYATSRFVYKKDNWNIRLTTPVNYRSFAIEDATLNEAQDLNHLTFEPNFYIKNKFSAFWETSLSANLSNDFGDMNQVYFGFILNNYRNLQNYNSPLPENFSQNYSWQLRFRNPLKSLFANLSYSFGRTKRNLLYSNQIGQNAATIFEAVAQENYANSHRLNIKGSKYFSKLNTTLSLGSSYSISNREQLLNGNLADVENQNLGFKLDLESEITDWLSASYTGNFSFLQTRFEARNFDEIRTQQHELDLFFYLADNQYFSVDSEYYFNNISEENRNNYFLNVSYQYTFKDSGIDLEASWNNVLNTDEFVRVSNTDFAYVQSTYRLRPSQVLVSLKFSF